MSSEKLNEEQNSDNENSNDQEIVNNDKDEQQNNKPSNDDSDLEADDENQKRSIGRWFIGETLGKGGYSWVKKGYDKKTGKCVALKFMAKADDTWMQEQSKQVITEIDSLKQIRHPNVMKLYAYNLNARYPTKGKEKIDTILLVLEYAPGGELFDILYYTSALESIVARTYFRQMIAGIEACHNAGVIHRDIKPQNLLLDSRFNLKLTDFGLSKVLESDADAIMKTTYVGTRGYQAPELLLEKTYDLECDVFSAGVVLFILLTGYPPFEQAHVSDNWFKPLAKGDFEKFWKAHRACPIANDAKVKDLLQKMLMFDPKKRITIGDVKKHPWYNDKILEGKDLIRALRDRHKEMETKRRKDSRKIKDLQQSIKVNRSFCPVCSKEETCRCFTVELFPENEIENIVDTHTTADVKDIINTVIAAVGKDGHVVLEPKECKLVCASKIATDINQDAQLIKFELQIYQSREYRKSEEEKANNDTVYVVRLRRLEGDLIQYRKIKKYLFDKCTEVLTGLPEWALKLQEQKLEFNTEEENGDDYEVLLKDDLNNFEENDNLSKPLVVSV